MPGFAQLIRRRALAALFLAFAIAGPSSIAAQDQAIDSDISFEDATYSDADPGDEQPARSIAYAPIDGDIGAQPGFSNQTSAVATQSAPAEPGAGPTWQEDDLVGAAEGIFGKGAQGLAEMIRDVLKKQGEPNAYIVGREGGGAFVLGARYGSGTLYHKIEGQRPVYWRGPSLGLDAGANAGNTFVLVYNLYDGEDLFKTYGAGEGQAYLVGGFHLSYLRRNDVVLIPVRMGAGLRLGLNVGYMKFSEKQKWLPF
jgi:hypothetical protein